MLICAIVNETERVKEMTRKSYAVQLLKIVKNSKRGISYEKAAASLKATNPQLENTSKNTIGIKNILDRLVENEEIKKTKSGNYKF